MERKGLCKTAEVELTKFLVETGRSNSTLLGDNEPALIALMTRVIKNLGTAATYRLTPNFSPQSKGNCERRHGTILGQLKTIMSDVFERYKLTTLPLTHPLWHWAVKRCCFLVNRYLIHDDGQRLLVSTLQLCRERTLPNF